MSKTQKVFTALTVAAFLAVCFALVAVGLWFLRGSSSKRFYNTSTVIQQVQTLSQLVTVKYVMEKVVVFEDVKWSETFGKSRVLMVAHGVVKAGVDLGQLTAKDVRISGKRISIVLPSARVTDAYLDETKTQVIERTTGLLRAFDKDLEQTARQQALDDIQRAARHNGILSDAEERARTQLANLFHQLGYEQVEFSGQSPVLQVLPQG